MKLILKGNPISQSRPRSSGNRFYNPNADQKKQMKWKVASQMRENGFVMPPVGPIEIEMVFSLQIPKSLSKRKQEVLRDTHQFAKPDIDNLAKFYLDVLSGIAIKDDNLVCCLLLKKLYSPTPNVEIWIRKPEGI